MKILVADDEPIVLESCRLVLETEQFQVRLCGSADEALQALDRELPSLLLVDVKMPVHDGMFLVTRVKKRYPHLPVILMSGYPTKEIMLESSQKGAATFLAKPFTPDELLETVRRVLNKEEENHGTQEGSRDR